MSDENGKENKEEQKEKRNWQEEIKVTGSEVVEKIKELVREGNVRRIIIKNEEGKEILEVPLTLGIVGAALAPILAAVGAAAALVAKCTLVVVKDPEAEEEEEEAEESTEVEKVED